MTKALHAEPWRLFFPLGALALWAGVSHWVLFAVGWSSDSSSVFHGIAQTQGFVLAIAFGFLLTMLPRRTRARAAGTPTLLVLALGSVGAAAAVRFGRVREGESMFAVAIIVALWFVLRCMRHGERRAPASFVWIPLAFGMALLGALLTGVGVALGGRFFVWHAVGKLLVTQGMIVALLLGAGSIAVPLMTRGESPPDADRDPAATRKIVTAYATAAVLVVGFVVEAFDHYALGNLIRAVAIAGALVPALGLFRPVTLRGAHRTAMRVAAGMVPLGHAFAALPTPWPRLGLHIVFAGGFAPLALIIALHVALAHGGRSELAERNPPTVIVMLALLATALVLRCTAELDALHRFAWLGAAGGAMLIASIAWAVVVLPRCIRGSAAHR